MELGLELGLELRLELGLELGLELRLGSKLGLKLELRLELELRVSSYRFIICLLDFDVLVTETQKKLRYFPLHDGTRSL